MNFSIFGRFIAIVVILANLVAGLSSCGKDKNDDTTTADTTAKITTSDTTAPTADDTDNLLSDDTDIAKDSGWTKDYQ